MSTNEIEIDNKKEYGIKNDDIKHTTECVQPLDFSYQGTVISMDTSSRERRDQMNLRVLI